MFVGTISSSGAEWFDALLVACVIVPSLFRESVSSSVWLWVPLCGDAVGLFRVEYGGEYGGEYGLYGGEFRNRLGSVSFSDWLMPIRWAALLSTVSMCNVPPSAAFAALFVMLRISWLEFVLSSSEYITLVSLVIL